MLLEAETAPRFLQCGNLFPSPAFATELEEIVQKSRDPDSGRSLRVSCSQYLSAHFLPDSFVKEKGKATG